MSRHRLRTVMACLIVAAAACGGGDDDANGAATAESGDPPVPATDRGEGDDGGGGAVTMPDLPTISTGTCSVTVTGDHEASWEGGGTAGDYLISYWLDEEQLEFIGGEFSLLLNCVDGGNMLTIASGPTASGETVPMAPGSYDLTTGDLEDRLFGVLITLADSQTNWGVAEPGGTIELTRFDESGIAGTFELPMEDALAEFGEGDEGNIVVTGEFDFPRV